MRITTSLPDSFKEAPLWLFLLRLPPPVHYGNARAWPRARSRTNRFRDFNPPSPGSNQRAQLGPSPIRSGSFSIVALLTKRLPIRPIPEEIGVALVRNDVVGHGCRLNASLPPTLSAKRMNCKELLPCGAPSDVIASTRSRSASLIDLANYYIHTPWLQ
jgi:hypothetical protein